MDIFSFFRASNSSESFQIESLRDKNFEQFSQLEDLRRQLSQEKLAHLQTLSHNRELLLELIRNLPES